MFLIAPLADSFLETDGLVEALPALTGLTVLALDNCLLATIPPQITLLQQLRFLSLHGVLRLLDLQLVELMEFGEEVVRQAQQASLAALAALPSLMVLSLSECSLDGLPPEVLAMTQLQVWRHGPHHACFRCSMLS